MNAGDLATPGQIIELLDARAPVYVRHHPARKWHNGALEPQGHLHRSEANGDKNHDDDGQSWP